MYMSPTQELQQFTRVPHLHMRTLRHLVQINLCFLCSQVFALFIRIMLLDLVPIWEAFTTTFHFLLVPSAISEKIVNIKDRTCSSNTRYNNIDIVHDRRFYRLNENNRLPLASTLDTIILDSPVFAYSRSSAVLAKSFFAPMTTDTRSSAVLAKSFYAPMNTYSRSSTLFTPRFLTSMIAKARASTLLTLRLLAAMFTDTRSSAIFAA
jgi:hypothetical protein